MPGRMVEFGSNATTTRGYLATPDAGRGPGVVVIQEWWGLVDHVKDVADRFAREGFVALAPDLYQGQTTTNPDAAGKLMMALTADEAARDLRGSVAYLLQQGGATGSRVGVIGFCMGGQLALYAATVSPDQVGAAANFYGVHPNIKPDLSRVKAAVLGSFAERDQLTPPEAVRQMEEQLRQRGVELDFKIYPGTDHAFFNDTRKDVYDQAAARDAWDRSLRFFRKHLV